MIFKNRTNRTYRVPFLHWELSISILYKLKPIVKRAPDMSFLFKKQCIIYDISKAPEIFSAREIALFLGPNIVSSVDPFWSGTYSYGLPYNCENFASILGANEIKYEFDNYSSAVNEPGYRDWRAITNGCNPDNEEGTTIQEQALPSIYTLQPCNPQEVRVMEFFPKIIFVSGISERP